MSKKKANYRMIYIYNIHFSDKSIQKHNKHKCTYLYVRIYRKRILGSKKNETRQKYKEV